MQLECLTRGQNRCDRLLLMKTLYELSSEMRYMRQRLFPPPSFRTRRERKTNPTHLVCYRTVHALQFRRIPGIEIHGRGFRGDEGRLGRSRMVLKCSDSLTADLVLILTWEDPITYRTRYHISKHSRQELSPLLRQLLPESKKLDIRRNRLEDTSANSNLQSLGIDCEPLISSPKLHRYPRLVLRASFPEHIRQSRSFHQR